MYLKNNCRSASLENELLTHFNCPIKTTSEWRIQGVLECFEVDIRLCHTSCTLSGLRPTTTLSPQQARTPDTPKSENLMPLTWATKLPSKTPSNDAISLPSTRRISETSLNTSSRLALHAQSSLPQCSREFRNVITLRRKISYVITRQDGCHKRGKTISTS